MKKQYGWIKYPERIERTDYCREFDSNNGYGGYSFPCNKEGKVKLYPCKEAHENYRKCLNGEYDVTDKGIVARVTRYWELGKFRCHCGHVMEIDAMAFTNTCEKCGRDYNSNGQELAPRSQWGEDTGETADQILSECGNHVS